MMPENKTLRSKILSCWQQSDNERDLAISGTSMKPLIAEGDTLTFVPIGDTGRIPIGDIVVFEGEKGLIAHRIVDKMVVDGGLFYKEKGDNRFYPSLIPESVIIGTVCRITGSAGTIDLTSRRWIFLNRLCGNYWRVLFRGLNRLVDVKQCIFGAEPRFMNTTLKRGVFFLVSLPSRFFRSR